VDAGRFHRSGERNEPLGVLIPVNGVTRFPPGAQRQHFGANAGRPQLPDDLTFRRADHGRLIRRVQAFQKQQQLAMTAVDIATFGYV